MSHLYFLIIFITTLLMYFYIMNQYKTSEDLEIYEMDYINNENLQETCDIKQPVVFRRGEEKIPDLTSCKQLLNVKDMNDYEKIVPVHSIELPCNAVIQLLHHSSIQDDSIPNNNDKNNHYFTENNSIFLDEINMDKIFTKLDKELQPTLITMSKKYDICMGCKNSHTPLRYHRNSRKYIYVVQGNSIRIKMTSWKFSKYLHEIKDFENLEYRSEINVWNQTNNKFENDLDKVHFIEFDVPLGSILSIPSYWWYSIKYTEPSTIFLECNYNSIVNNLSNIFEYGMFFIQNQNIIKNFTKPIDEKGKYDEKEKENENEKDTDMDTENDKEEDDVDQEKEDEKINEKNDYEDEDIDE